ncbi:MAG TPA: tetratricopeptide repeat protein [Chitinophaga sp.]
MIGFVSITQAFAARADHESKARQLYKAGLAFRNSGQLQAAVTRFTAAINLYQSFTDAYLQLGDIYRIQQQPKKAATQYQAALERQPGHVGAMRGLAVASYEQHEYEQALTYALPLRQQGVTGESLLIGQCYAALNDDSAAIDALTVACAEMPSSSEPPYLLAQLYAAGGHYDASIRYYRQAIRIDSNRSQLYYELGMIYFNTNDYTQAVQHFEHAAALGQPLNADYYYNLGVACLKMARPDRGIALLQTALRLRPGDIPVIYTLAHTYYARQEFKEAIEQWNLLLSLQPENAFAWFMLGKSYMGAGDTVKGSALCDKALSMSGHLQGGR